MNMRNYKKIVYVITHKHSHFCTRNLYWLYWDQIFPKFLTRSDLDECKATDVCLQFREKHKNLQIRAEFYLQYYILTGTKVLDTTDR
jgi:hypothetical protein